jgi:hypothetical protein
MATVEELTIAALAKNKTNQPEVLEGGTEMLDVYNRVLRGLYAIAARVNPGYFGAIVAVTPSAGVWARPAAELVYRVETAAGARVFIVPVDDRGAQAGNPAIWPWGQGYRVAVAGDGPGASDVLTFYTSSLAPTATAVSQETPPAWPDSFDDMIVVLLAMYLAAKDERAQDLPGLQKEEERWLALYIAHLEHETVGMSRAVGVAGHFQGPSMLELKQLLAFKAQRS